MIKPVTSLVVAGIWAASAAARAQEEPLAAFQKKVQETAKKVTDAFVFVGGGSGVLVSADGWILSNYHVVAGLGGRVPKGMRVNLASGETFLATIHCTDPVGDIALLKVQAPRELPFVELADSDRLEPGQYVMAVGNPFSLADPAADRRWYPSVSLGIVSAVHRYQDQYSDCLQTDAALNPGNSGGPLVTLDGRLAGINGRIATRFGNRVNSGVGYAVPANQIRNFLAEMKNGGINGRVYHGQIRGLDLERKPPDGRGALVSFVRDSSTAARSGFKKGDLVVEVNGQAITSRWRLLGCLGTYPMETEVEIKVRRGEELIALKVRLDRSDERDIMGRPPRDGGGYLGVVLEDRRDGTTVSYVAGDSPAERAGLAVGDKILKVDGRPVTSRETVLERVRLRKPGDTVVLLVEREGEELELAVTLGSKGDE